jgi:hypothetical protein
MFNTNRRDFVALLGSAALAWPLAARAQPAGKLPTIGYLGTVSASAWAPWTAAFVQRLHELGWIDGRTVAIQYRWAEGRAERLAEIAGELVRLKVDVIVTGGNAALAAKQASSVVPIVFALVDDPVGMGLIANLGRPGGNVTGLALQSADTRQASGAAARDCARSAPVGDHGQCRYPAAALEMDQVQAAARALGIDLMIEHRSLDYDYATAAAKIRGARLPQEYAAALETGLWPSCDVLPLKEIHERGAALAPGSAFWSRPPQLEGTSRRKRSPVCTQLWPHSDRDTVPKLQPQKFKDPNFTATGQPRASVTLRRLKTLWFNTGTLCNIACRNCYIESSPRNDRLVYLTRSEVAAYLDEIERDGWGTEEIGFTGGEPFMNPDFFDMLEDCLSRDFRVLVLSNAMRPMQRAKPKLLDVQNRFGDLLTLRVSLDHFTPERHEDERGPGTFKPTLDGLIWLASNGFNVAVAGRTMWREDPKAERAGYAWLFAEHGIKIDVEDPSQFVLFPEIDARADVPEITTGCWSVLGKSDDNVMCATSRMIVKRKGSEHPVVVACTLVPYEKQFELGPTLYKAKRSVLLNHPNCARFCVLGGASCSAR